MLLSEDCLCVKKFVRTVNIKFDLKKRAIICDNLKKRAIICASSKKRAIICASSKKRAIIYLNVKMYR